MLVALTAGSARQIVARHLARAAGDLAPGRADHRPPGDDQPLIARAVVLERLRGCGASSGRRSRRPRAARARRSRPGSGGSSSSGSIQTLTSGRGSRAPRQRREEPLLELAPGRRRRRCSARRARRASSGPRDAGRVAGDLVQDRVEVERLVDLGLVEGALERRAGRRPRRGRAASGRPSCTGMFSISVMSSAVSVVERWMSMPACGAASAPGSVTSIRALGA